MREGEGGKEGREEGRTKERRKDKKGIEGMKSMYGK